MLGVIAGSEGSLLSPDGCLDRDTYVNLSPRMYPVFASHRELVYGMFMLYLKRKRELDDYDSADRYIFLVPIQFSSPGNRQNPCHHTLYDERTSGAAKGFSFVRHTLFDVLAC